MRSMITRAGNSIDLWGEPLRPHRRGRVLLYTSTIGEQSPFPGAGPGQFSGGIRDQDEH